MCQACHGDASEHLKDPTKAKPANPFSRLTPATATEQSNVCLDCHTGSRHLTFWESGKHAKQDVSCANCHSIHGQAAQSGGRAVHDELPARTRRTSAARATSRSARRS